MTYRIHPRVKIASITVGLAVGLSVGCWRLIQSTEPTVTAGVIGIFATALTSTFTVVVGKYVERTRMIEAQRHDKRTTMYTMFLKGLAESLGLGQPSGKRRTLTPSQNAKIMSEFVQSAFCWASADVIREVVKWKEMANGSEVDPLDALGAIENIIKAIRKDLGAMDGDQLDNNAILRLFVNDLDALKK